MRLVTATMHCRFGYSGQCNFQILAAHVVAECIKTTLALLARAAEPGGLGGLKPPLNVLKGG